MYAVLASFNQTVHAVSVCVTGRETPEVLVSDVSRLAS